MTEKPPTEVDRAVAKAKNSRWLAPLIFVGVVIVALGAFTDGLSKIGSFFGLVGDRPDAAESAIPSDSAVPETPRGVTLVSGTVRSEGGPGLQGVSVDVPGVGSAVTDGNGGFRIPVDPPGTWDSLRLTLDRVGYQQSSLEVRADEAAGLSVALRPVGVRADNLLTVANQFLVGHHVGIPQVDIQLGFHNPSPKSVAVTAPTLTIEGPDGSRWELFPSAVYPAPGMAMLPALPQILLPPAGSDGESFEMIWVFTGRDLGGAELSAAVQAELLADAGFRTYGPRLSSRVLSEETAERVETFLREHFPWAPGEWSFELSAVVGGSTLTWTRTASLSDDQVESMRKMSQYYPFGFGLIFGGHLNPIGEAHPAHYITVQP